MRGQKDRLALLLSACDTIEADRRHQDGGVKRSRSEEEDAQVRFRTRRSATPRTLGLAGAVRGLGLQTSRPCPCRAMRCSRLKLFP